VCAISALTSIPEETMRRLFVSLVLVLSIVTPSAFAGEDAAAAPSAVPSLEELFPATDAMPVNDCWYSYQWCQSWCSPGDEGCLVGCECSYYMCKGMDLPNYCIW
jgi:hypothetical protein